MKLLLTFIVCVFSFNSYACSVPKPGFDYSMEELVDKSKNIFLVEMVNVVKKEYRNIYTLKVVEVLKGVKSGDLTFYSYRDEYHDNDFDGHNDSDFWVKDFGRSKWPCCICGPDHSFEKNVKYLYFPDSLGALKSAEIIKSKEDKWYKFVKNRLKK